MTKVQTAERDEAITRLREWLKPGDTVYTVLEHVSRSGMQREIRVLLARTGDDGRVHFIHPNHAAAKALGCRQGKRDGLIVGGCGMDMGFHLVYNLGRMLFPDGFAVLGLGRNGAGWDKNGGYALEHRWL